MIPQCLNGIEFAGQLGLAQRRMNFVVTNLVHQDSWPRLTTAQFWRQVVLALARFGWDRAMT